MASTGRKRTGQAAQLLNAIDESALERLLGGPPLAITPWSEARSSFGNPVLDLGSAVRLRQALLAGLPT